MVAFVIRRAALALLLVFVAASGALWLTRLAPGDLTSEIALDASAAEIAGRRERFGLDRGVAAQWAGWIGRTLRLDFGESSLYDRPVAGLIGRAAANTAILAAAALCLATLLGIPSGMLTGSRSGGAAASAIRGASIACLSLPPLLTSLVLVWLASRTGWLPVGGMTTATADGPGWGRWLADVAWPLPLPTLALALPLAATLERLQSQAMSEAVREPFVRAAAARGVSPRRLLIRHAWRVSLRPVVGLSGIIVGGLLSGSFAVEYVTAWPGLGRLMYEALRARDVYLVAGCVAAGALFLGLGSLVSDVLLAVVDPRVTHRAESV